MSWEFKRDPEYLKKREALVKELQIIDSQVRDMLLADFIIMYNSWNWTELLKELKALGVDDGEAGSQKS